MVQASSVFHRLMQVLAFRHSLQGPPANVGSSVAALLGRSVGVRQSKHDAHRRACWRFNYFLLLPIRGALRGSRFLTFSIKKSCFNAVKLRTRIPTRTSSDQGPVRPSASRIASQPKIQSAECKVDSEMYGSPPAAYNTCRGTFCQFRRWRFWAAKKQTLFAKFHRHP